MSIIETLWMMGELEEERYKYAKIKLASTITSFSNEVFRVTNHLKNLDTGRGTTEHRINQQLSAMISPVEPADNVSEEETPSDATAEIQPEEELKETA